jgi:hydroxymethylbilane synthase
MLPAPAQGSIMVVCREEDHDVFTSCQCFNHEDTALCTKIERDFLKELMGGCSTPISALAKIRNGHVTFKGNIASPDGDGIASIESKFPVADANEAGFRCAKDILVNDGQAIIDKIKNATK